MGENKIISEEIKTICALIELKKSRMKEDPTKLLVNSDIYNFLKQHFHSCNLTMKDFEEFIELEIVCLTGYTIDVI